MSDTKNIYAARSEADVLRLVRQQPLAWIVSGAGEDFRATLLPILAEADGEGRITKLHGHFSRANDQHQPRCIARNPERAHRQFFGYIEKFSEGKQRHQRHHRRHQQRWPIKVNGRDQRNQQQGRKDPGHPE